MGKFAAVAIILSFVISGCEKNDKQTDVESTSANAGNQSKPDEPKKPVYSVDDWRRDFYSTFQERGAKIDDDGVKSYVACFDPGEGNKCGMGFSANGDGFRKASYLTPIMTSLSGVGGILTIIDMHVAAIECRPAVAMITPSFNGTDGWLFMNRVAFMADGKVVYEKSSEANDVKRDNQGRWVHERWGIKLDKADFHKFQDFSKAESRIIRISGDKGYYTVGKREVKVFSDDVLNLIEATNRINSALESGGGADCAS